MRWNRGETVSLVFVVAAFAASAALYPRLPEAVPTHWNLHGQVDGFSHKPFAPFVLPVVMAGMLLFFRLLPSISPRGFRFERFAGVWALFEAAVIGALLLDHGLTLAAGLGKPVDGARGAIAGTGLLLALIGNYLGKVTRNFFVGIRTPWTLASEEVWMRTHRFGGKLFVLAGLILFVTALAGAGVVLGFAAVIAAAIGSVVYSYVVYRKVEGFGEGGPPITSAGSSGS
jgi:immunity protein, SdpI family